jgi:hypothetical protein
MGLLLFYCNGGLFGSLLFHNLVMLFYPVARGSVVPQASGISILTQSGGQMPLFSCPLLCFCKLAQRVVCMTVCCLAIW